MAEKTRPVREGDVAPDHDRLTIWLWQSYGKYLQKIFDFAQAVDRGRIEAARLHLGTRLSDTELFPDAVWEADDLVTPEKAVTESPADTLELRSQRRRLLAVFEIQPQVASLAGIMRQMNAYRHAVADEIGTKAFVVVTEDDRFDDIFTEQGIVVIHPGVDEALIPPDGLEERRIEMPEAQQEGYPAPGDALRLDPGFVSVPRRG